MKKVIILLAIWLSSQSVFTQKKAAIYWDTSYSMKDRQINQELQYLNNYFKKNKDVIVNLVTFSNTIILQENYQIRDGDWSKLSSELRNTVYDGATSYSNLFKEGFDEYLLFTDGIENIDKLKPVTNKPVYIVSTIPNSNTINLKLIADLSSGAYVYLTNDGTVPDVTEKIEQSISDDIVGFVTGTVSGSEGSLANVSIINQNSKIGATTEINGNYRIKAEENDVLVYTYLGKRTVNIRISKANIVNIFMQDVDVNLEEVVITTEAEKEDLVNTGNTTVNKRSLGYTTESISEDAISSLDTDVKQAVSGQFSNLKLSNNGASSKTDLSQFLGRGNNMTITGNQYGLIILDGVPMQGSDSSVFNNSGGVASTSHIDPELIVDITYLKGLAATNKYGTLGANGVLLITTKNAVGDKASANKKVNLGTTATYSGNAEQIEKLPDTPYINALKVSKTIEEAFDNYLEQRDIYGEIPEFYLDVYDYFEAWNNDLLSTRVLSNIYEVGFDKVDVLRALSYKQQASGDYSGAVKTLERVLKLNPKQSQSYRDLALAKTYNGDYNGALKLYDKMDKNMGVGNSNFGGIKKTITNDAKNLISKHGNQLNTTGINQLYLRPIKYKSRIVFEWNDFNSEFDLNIVNPQKRFFTSSNTRAESFQKMEQQRQEGYGLEEFYLTSNDIGQWTFNMKYFGNSSKTPTYLKITTYNNFGHPNETKEIKVIRLEKQNIEQTVAELVVN